MYPFNPFYSSSSIVIGIAILASILISISLVKICSRPKGERTRWVVGIILSHVMMIFCTLATTADLANYYRLMDQRVEGFDESGVPLRSFSASDGSFSIELPATWQRMRISSPQATLQLGHVLGQPYFKVLTLTKDELLVQKLEEFEQQ